MLAVADAEDQRAAEPRGDEHARMVAENDRQAIRAAQLRQRRLDRLDQRLVVVPRGVVQARSFEALGDQMSDDLRVGGRTERVALGDEAFAQRFVVLDHAVVDDGQQAIAAEMGVGIGVVGRTVRGPARVPDARPATQRRLLGEPFEPLDAAGALDDHQPAIRTDQRQAGAIVAAILQPAQAR